MFLITTPFDKNNGGKLNIDNNEVLIGIYVHELDFRAFATDLSDDDLLGDRKYKLLAKQIPLLSLGSISFYLYKILKSEIPKCQITENSLEEYIKKAIVRLSEREISELLK